MSNKIYKIGDKIDIKYTIDKNTELSDNAIITYINNDHIYTCGHCFPKNATLKYGDLIYSSGFDTIDEENELAVIKLKPQYINLFKTPEILNKQINFKNNNTIMINNGSFYKGAIIKKITNDLQIGWQNLNSNIMINHQINKLKYPYYIIKTNIELKSGLSGSPWIIQENDKLYLLGSHIGRATGMEDNKIIEISYVNIINSDGYSRG